MCVSRISLAELQRLVGERLDQCACARFVTGSVASTVFGEPRFTNDINIVVRMDESAARHFAGAFTGDDWCVSVEAAVEAARRAGCSTSSMCRQIESRHHCRARHSARRREVCTRATRRNAGRADRTVCFT